MQIWYEGTDITGSVIPSACTHKDVSHGKADVLERRPGRRGTTTEKLSWRRLYTGWPWSAAWEAGYTGWKAR